MPEFLPETDDLELIDATLQPFYQQNAEGKYVFSAVPKLEHDKKTQSLKKNAEEFRQKAHDVARQFGIDNPDTSEGGRAFKEKTAKARALLTILEENGLDPDGLPDLLGKLHTQSQGQSQGQNAALDAKYQLEIRQQKRMLEETTARLTEMQKERDILTQKEVFRNARDKLTEVGTVKGLTPVALSSLESLVRSGELGFEGADLVAKCDMSIYGVKVSEGTDLTTIVDTLAMQNIVGFLQPSKGMGLTNATGVESTKTTQERACFNPNSPAFSALDQRKIWERSPELYRRYAKDAGLRDTGKTSHDGMPLYSVK